MVIGKGGSGFKNIGARSSKRYENLIWCQSPFLELWVKVKSGWADDERALRSIGLWFR